MRSYGAGTRTDIAAALGTMLGRLAQRRTIPVLGPGRSRRETQPGCMPPLVPSAGTRWQYVERTPRGLRDPSPAGMSPSFFRMLAVLEALLCSRSLGSSFSAGSCSAQTPNRRRCLARYTRTGRSTSAASYWRCPPRC